MSSDMDVCEWKMKEEGQSGVPPNARNGSSGFHSEEGQSDLDISFIQLPQMDPSQIPKTTNPSQIISAIVDFFRPHVATDLGVDFFIFFTSSASMLGFMLYSPTLYDSLLDGKKFFELEEDESLEIRLPGFDSPIPLTALPEPFFNRQEGHALWLKNWLALPFYQRQTF